MRERPLGTTGLRVSEIGLGTWGMGGMWGPRDDALAVRTMLRAMELGVTLFDTALAYGDGHSEQLVARAFREAGRRVAVATKVPPKNHIWPAKAGTPLREAFPRDWIIRCTERSLRNLETEALEIQQLHVWADGWMDDPEWAETLHDLKAQGKIQVIGVSINDHDPTSAIRLTRSGLVGSLQVIYNLFDQQPADELFPLAQAPGKEVGIIARCPFDEGGLTGTLRPDSVFHKDDWRRDYFQGDRLRETLERAERFRFLVRGEITSLSQAALKFCLSHPAVSTVIPGMRRPAHVEENCAVSNGRLFSPAELERARAHAWSRNFYD